MSTVKPKTPKAAENAFASAADVLGTGIDALFAQSDAPEFMVDLDEIEVIGQIREEMENDEQDLAALGESLKQYQIQAILLRIMPAGPKPYRLVAGERRYRAARLAGLTQLRAKAREMTDEEAEDFQFAENVHRKNLTQIEEAKKIQRDLDRLGSVDAVLEKHRKSRAWLSKILSLLSLPEQARRLVTESVSADVEVINAVKIVEKADPQAAKELVDDLKATRGRSSAREKVNAVKETVKPKGDRAGGGGVVATPKDRSHEEPGPVIFADAKTRLNNAYVNIFEHGSNPNTVLTAMSDDDRIDVDVWLRAFHVKGAAEKDVGRAVIQGFRAGQFASDGGEAFALVAFLQGADGRKYSLLDVLSSIRA